MDHVHFMNLALKEAETGGQNHEVPIGALIVSHEGNIIASNYNQVITLSDPSAHAEILVLREASRKILNYRLLKTTIYVTVEPCIMCMGAIIHARVAKIVFGTYDPKWGACGSLYDFSNDNRLNHHPEIISGVCENECKQVIQNFFRMKRSFCGKYRNYWNTVGR
ncbi:MAG: nucleoside deaminase [Desulfobacterales bacterium]|nr:nucleoside deaminase [Desulfobacterales bacterium]